MSKDKHDDGKSRWSLMPWKALRKLMDVLEFGAHLYSPNSWQSLEDGKRRYTDALLRHVVAYMCGERDDQESHLHHLAHAATNALFVMTLEDEDDSNRH